MFEEKVGACYSCGYDGIKVTRYDRHNPGIEREEDKIAWYCDLCAGSFAGNAYDYSHYENRPLYATVCYVGNAILQELRKRDAEGPRPGEG